MSVVTTATRQDVISAMVQSQLTAEAKLMFTVQDFSALVGKGAKSVSFPRGGDLTPAAKTVGTATTAQALTYAVDKLDLDKYAHVYVKLEDLAEIQSSIADIEADIMARAGKGMAKSMDTAIYTALKAGASASAPTHVLNWFESGTLDETKILQARELLNVQNCPQEDRFLVVSPKQEKQMLAIANFVQAERYGSNQTVQNGEIGRVYGFRVIMTSVCEDDVALAYHASAVAFARQKDPTWEEDRDLANLSNEYSLSSIYGVKVLDAGKRNIAGLDLGE